MRKRHALGNLQDNGLQVDLDQGPGSPILVPAGWSFPVEQVLRCMMDHNTHNGKRGPFVFSANIVLIAFLAIGGFYLVTEHRAHLYGFWPLLFVLPCLVMHFFMHHGGHGDRQEAVSAEAQADVRRDVPPHQH